MTFNFLGPGLTVNVEAKVKEQIILDSSEKKKRKRKSKIRFLFSYLLREKRPPSRAGEYCSQAALSVWRILGLICL